MSETPGDFENIHLCGIDWRAPTTWFWYAGTVVLSAVISAGATMLPMALFDPKSSLWIDSLSVGLLAGAAIASAILVFKKYTIADGSLWKSGAFRKLDVFWVGLALGFMACCLSLAILSGVWKMLEIQLPPPIVGCTAMSFVSAAILIRYVGFYLRFVSSLHGISSTG